VARRSVGGPLAVSGPMLLETRARLEHHCQPTWAADCLAPKIFRAALRMWKLVIVIAFGAVCSLPGVAIAQQAQQSSSPPSASKESSAKPEQVGPQGTQVLDTNQLVILIRSTLLAVNHANLTGNYSVLRDLGTPGFQQSNTAATLAEIFKDLRDRNLDLGPIALIDAKLRKEPSVDAKGRLRLTGFFPSRPEQVNFDLNFYYRNGRWRLDGIALNTTPSQGAATEPNAPTASNGNAPATTAAPKPPASPNKPKTGSPASQKPSAEAKTLPDVKERVELLEVSPPAQAKKPEPKSESWYPFQ